MNLLSIQEAAEFLNVHVDTLRQWEEQGYLTPHRTPGNHRRYEIEELKELLMKTGKPKLTTLERQKFINQYLILAKLYPDEKKHYEEMTEVFLSGYEAFYDFDWIDSNTLSKEESDEVLEIMNMFWHLQCDYELLQDKDNIEKAHLVFRGFDGNYEGKQRAFAEFYRRHDGGRYFKDLVVETDNLNSHYPMLDRYRSMLEKWNKINGNKPQINPRYFSKNEILETLNSF